MVDTECNKGKVRGKGDETSGPTSMGAEALLGPQRHEHTRQAENSPIEHASENGEDGKEQGMFQCFIKPSPNNVQERRNCKYACEYLCDYLL